MSAEHPSATARPRARGRTRPDAALGQYVLRNARPTEAPQWLPRPVGSHDHSES